MPIKYGDFNIKTIEELELCGKRVFIRCDFNVPLDLKGSILDDTRIKAALPTIHYALSHEAKIILASHLGRPSGNFDPSLSLEPVAARLSELLDRDIIMTDDCLGDAVHKIVDEMKPQDVVLLENLRFNIAERKNNPTFAHHIAEFVDVYINDAFGTCHRSHASVDSLPRIIKQRGCGFLIRREIENLAQVVDHPKRPYIAIVGGSKVSDKIELLRNLMVRADTLLIGGALAYTFLKASGKSVGKSLVEEDKMNVAKNLFEKAEQEKVKLLLPIDHVISKSPSSNIDMKVTSNGEIADGYYGVDIGPQTVALFERTIKRAKSIVWNGPLGVYEQDAFAQGTQQVAQAIASANAFSIVGGGDCVAAVNAVGVSHHISHISTGGGATLLYLEGQVLPGLAALHSDL